MRSTGSAKGGSIQKVFNPVHNADDEGGQGAQKNGERPIEIGLQLQALETEESPSAKEMRLSRSA
ncbi:hypothetical protein LTR39_002580, partial [Cryomyces antarcticus]